MSTLDTLLQRNRQFAEQDFTQGLSLMPTLRAMVISCVDPRVDPAHLLGLAPGEALVIRNIGGRINPGTLQIIRILQTIAQVEGAAVAADFSLIVLQHTDCGITRLDSKPDLLANYFGTDKAELDAKDIHDPYAAVALDIATLKANAPLPATWTLAGLVYDVTTGLVKSVVTTTPA